jgi:hypothetical protein
MSGFGDELGWSAAWLLRATNDSKYKTDFEKHWTEFKLDSMQTIQGKIRSIECQFISYFSEIIDYLISILKTYLKVLLGRQNTRTSSSNR